MPCALLGLALLCPALLCAGAWPGGEECVSSIAKYPYLSQTNTGPTMAPFSLFEKGESKAKHVTTPFNGLLHVAM